MHWFPMNFASHGYGQFVLHLPYRRWALSYGQLEFVFFAIYAELPGPKCLWLEAKRSSAPHSIALLIDTIFMQVLCCEMCHVIGLAILAFVVLPELDVIKGVMLSNAVCLLPAVLSNISLTTVSNSALNVIVISDVLNWSLENKGKITNTALDVLAVFALLTAIIILPIVSNSWSIPIALSLISIRWWENFVSPNSAISTIYQLN